MAKKSNRHLKIVITFTVLSLGLIFFLYRGLQVNPNVVPSVLINKPAQDFTALTLQGEEFLPENSSERFSLSSLKGKPVILNFWASWCFACRQEAKDFELFWQSAKNAGIMVVGIAIQDQEEAALAFAKNYGKTYPLGLDEEGKIAIDYGVTGVPETFVIDENGTIIEKITGPVDYQKLIEIVKTLKK